MPLATSVEGMEALKVTETSHMLRFTVALATQVMKS